jgi:transposase
LISCQFSEQRLHVCPQDDNKKSILCPYQLLIRSKRWDVERTIGWMSNWRGLSKHDDEDSKTGETKILLASIHYFSKRLTKQKNTKMNQK